MSHQTITIRKSNLKSFILILITLLVSLSIFSIILVSAKSTRQKTEQISALHPPFELLDHEGRQVQISGAALSTMQTCGVCHDTSFIQQHSYHADVGLKDFSVPGQYPDSQPWDSSPGYFGKWDPINYRYLSPVGDERIDLSTAEWIQLYGPRHSGGGPAINSRDGQPLESLQVMEGNPETHILDPETGKLIIWNWQESGTVEMNCFLCHTPTPNNQTRMQALQDGQFRWANTATLIGSGLVEKSESNYLWNQAAFNENGELKDEYLFIQDPTNENCGLCHGLVHDLIEDPLVSTGCVPPSLWSTRTTGQIISGQRISASGMNLSNKDSISRSWDIHAERQLKCTDCHYSLNNPVYYQERQESRPNHLLFDPRRLEIGEYLYQPIHQFARGQSAQSSVAPEYKASMRRCESCHDAEKAHDWLPYQNSHFNAISCETCHIPKLYSGAFQQRDWTVIQPNSQPLSQCRGVEGESSSLEALVYGYEPVWLQSKNFDGETHLKPYNLITTWYWIYGNPPRPVRLLDLQTAWLDDNGQYHPDIIAQFDENNNGTLENNELAINNFEKQTIIQEHLTKIGLENPRIVGEILTFSINHDVTSDDWAIQDCQTCHIKNSRVTQSIQLASYIPGSALPSFAPGNNLQVVSEIIQTEDGVLNLKPESNSNNLYIFGHNKIPWIDLGGLSIFIGVLLGVTVHGSVRYRNARKLTPNEGNIKRVYMYATYERLWHWLQTFTIIGLLFTGLVVHNPDSFKAINFYGAVITHNVLATILAINAVLALFYHLASGEIRQYIPRPAGFFDQAISQAIYYLRDIFHGKPHPFEKTPEKKLNPLQQITYFGLLNVLLPLQGITGIMIWSASQWPDFIQSLGGLSLFAPLHTIIAWLFASFIVLHVYLTTTGHTPLSDISAMIHGWDEIEIHESVLNETDTVDDNKKSN